MQSRNRIMSGISSSRRAMEVQDKCRSLSPWIEYLLGHGMTVFSRKNRIKVWEKELGLCFSKESRGIYISITFYQSRNKNQLTPSESRRVFSDGRVKSSVKDSK